MSITYATSATRPTPDQAPAGLHHLSQARIPTAHGTFTMHVFREAGKPLEHLALVKGGTASSTMLRIHSECMTGDVFGSLRCDCGPQLQLALREVGQLEHGIILYLRQEGRGIGLVNKLRAYELQDQGLDTVEANLQLGFAPDQRDFAVAAHMLKSLGVQEVRLLTNNPRKVAALVSNGIHVIERIPAVSEPQAENSHYLATKALKLGHQMDWLP